MPRHPAWFLDSGQMPRQKKVRIAQRFKSMFPKWMRDKMSVDDKSESYRTLWRMD